MLKNSRDYAVAATHNNSLHRALPRNGLVQSATSGCTVPPAPQHPRVEGSAGELKRRYAP
jgi:hypothetical protein